MRHRHVPTSRRRFLTGSAGVLALAGSGVPLRALAQGGSPVATPAATPAEAPAVEIPDMTGVATSFPVGAFTAHAVSDGANAGPFVEVIVFGGTPEDEAQAVIQEAGIDTSQLVSQHTSTVIDTGSEMVLVDTGAGASGLPESGILIDNLRREGIQPTDIDVVVLTHGHPDHIGGNLTPTGNPIYSNARYVMAREEWDFWTDPAAVEAAAPSPDFLQAFMAAVESNLLPLEGTIELIGYDEEIVPGITSVDARGHTPGHMALRVESEGEQLWVMGDAALHSVHVAYPDVMGFPDMDPEQVAATRRRLYDEIAGAGALAAFNHFHPFPGVGTIAVDGETWAWQPREDAMPEDGEG